jgi:glycosyltransferase involved in cell wall biosynthesis
MYAAALAGRTRTPVVLSSHGETFMDDHDVFGTSALMRLGLRRAISAAAVTTGCSQQVLDDLRDQFGLVGGVVVPNGVAPAPTGASSGTPPDEVDLPEGPVVLGVGRLEQTKGFDLLVEAVAHLGPETGATLVLAGAGSQRDRLERLGREHRLGPRLRLVGPTDEAGVDGWMRRADVVVMPSRREAFGIVALEAWRAGTPLVATSLGGPASFVSDGVDGLLVDPVNVGALATAVGRVLADPGLARSLAVGGLRSVTDYTWTRVAQLYTDIHTAVLERR